MAENVRLGLDPNLNNYDKYKKKYDSGYSQENQGINPILKNGFGSLSNTEALPYENDPKMTMSQENRHTLRRLMIDYYNLALLFGSLSAKAIIDYIAKLVLNTNDISNASPEDLKKELNETFSKLSALGKDEEVQNKFGEASESLSNIFMIFLKHSRGPLMEFGKEAALIGSHSLMVAYQQAMNTLDDSIKLIPIIGEGYMITQNLMSMTNSATSISSNVLTMYDDLYEGFNEIKDALGIDKNYKSEQTNFIENLSDLKKTISKAWKQSVEKVQGPAIRAMDDVAAPGTKIEQQKPEEERVEKQLPKDEE